jgi:hypothetical protein
MKACGTYDDVNLILRLYEMRRETKLREAREWFVASFHAKNLDEWTELCPPGSDENAYFRMVVSYWEMVASFITGGVLQESLFFQSGRELLVCWVRFSPIVPAYRESIKDPAAFGNLEKVANNYIEWWSAQAPEAYEAFAERIGTAPKKK